MKYIKLFEQYIRPYIEHAYSGNREKVKELFLNNGFTQEDIDIIDNFEPERYFDNFNFIDDNTIEIYRNITVVNTEIEEFEKAFFNGYIGVYWSLNDSTRAIWGDQMDNLERTEYQCVGHLSIGDIDWEMMLYTFKEYPPHFCEEHEIRGINGGKTIKIVKCYLD